MFHTILPIHTQMCKQQSIISSVESQKGVIAIDFVQQ